VREEAERGRGRGRDEVGAGLEAPAAFASLPPRLGLRPAACAAACRGSRRATYINKAARARSPVTDRTSPVRRQHCPSGPRHSFEQHPVPPLLSAAPSDTTRGNTSICNSRLSRSTPTPPTRRRPSPCPSLSSRWSPQLRTPTTGSRPDPASPISSSATELLHRSSRSEAWSAAGRSPSEVRRVMLLTPRLLSGGSEQGEGGSAETFAAVRVRLVGWTRQAASRPSEGTDPSSDG
jgi:hypothetical protein